MKIRKMNSTKKIEAKLWQTCNKYLKYLRFIPFLKTVAVCNSLTFGNINSKSDIDLFIITKKNRLFITRTFVTFLFQILGKRRHGKKIHNRFCLSFFIDETHLNLEPIALKNDIYLAQWIENLVPYLDDGTLKKFRQENLWIKDILKKFKEKNSQLTEINKSKILQIQSSKTKKFLDWLLRNKFGNLIEKILQKWQIPRAQNKRSKILQEIKIHNKKIEKELKSHKQSKKYCGLIIKPNILKFHNYDKRREYNIFNKN